MILKSFNILGNLIKVKLVRTLYKKDAFGMWFNRKNEIHIQTNTKEFSMSKDVVNATFCHEVMHVMFEAVGRQDLSDNEQLVESMGQVLHQFLQNYEIKK